MTTATAAENKRASIHDFECGDVIKDVVVRGALRRVKVLEIRAIRGDLLVVPLDGPAHDCGRATVNPRPDGRLGDGTNLETDRCDKCGGLLRDADGNQVPKRVKRGSQVHRNRGDRFGGRR